MIRLDSDWTKSKLRLEKTGLRLDYDLTKTGVRLD